VPAHLPTVEHCLVDQPVDGRRSQHSSSSRHSVDSVDGAYKQGPA
jgi:hypothetical protein